MYNNVYKGPINLGSIIPWGGINSSIQKQIDCINILVSAAYARKISREIQQMGSLFSIGTNSYRSLSAGRHDGLSVPRGGRHEKAGIFRNSMELSVAEAPGVRWEGS